MKYWLIGLLGIVLPKKHRLPLRTEWQRLRKEGKVFQSPLFGLVVLKDEKLKIKNEKLFGTIVSKKVEKRAVARNRIKRLLLESVRKLLPRIGPGWEGVFLAKKGIIGKGLREVENEVESVLKRAGLLKRG